MPTSKLLNLTDKQAAEFANGLNKVLARLEKSVVDIASGAKVGGGYDAAVLLNSRPEMLQALRDSGYVALAEEHVAQYPEVASMVKEIFKDSDLPAPKFATVDKETFSQIARADLEGFNVIGTKAVEDLRLNLYKQAVSDAPFSDMVESIRAATVGTAKNGSPLSNYAYTHANTATLSFSGEVLRVAGESIGAEKWEVVGPNDSVTRDECQAALSDPVRTTEEWKSAGYFGGTPGGFNCRHQLYPVFADG